MAKNEGKRFEEDFKKSIPEWCWCNRYNLLELKSYNGVSIPLSGIRKS